MIWNVKCEKYAEKLEIRKGSVGTVINVTKSIIRPHRVNHNLLKTLSVENINMFVWEIMHVHSVNYFKMQVSFKWKLVSQTCNALKRNFAGWLLWVTTAEHSSQNREWVSRKKDVFLGISAPFWYLRISFWLEIQLGWRHKQKCSTWEMQC